MHPGSTARSTWSSTVCLPYVCTAPLASSVRACILSSFRSSWQLFLLRLAFDQVQQFLPVHAQRLASRTSAWICVPGKGFAAFLAQGFQRAGGNKTCRCRGRLYKKPFLPPGGLTPLAAVAGLMLKARGQLIGAGHRGFRGVLPPQDAILQQLRDLLVDQALVVEHPFQGIAPLSFYKQRLRGSLLV